MSNRVQAWGMWALSAVLLCALELNIQLRDAGQAYRPLHLMFCGPLALYCLVAGWNKWSQD
jgi:hypothetical protein